MVLLEVDSIGLAVFKLECNASGPVHMHGVALWLTVQSMKIKPLRVHVFGPACTVQRIKPDDAAFVH